MENTQKIKEELEHYAQKNPDIIMTRLKKGDLIPKSAGLAYEIDDPEIYKKLGDFPKGTIPYGPAHRALGQSHWKTFDLFQKEGVQRDGIKVLPFSRAVELGLGQCLEKAVLIQLAAQNGAEGFLVSGALEQTDSPAGFHAFNIVFKNGEVRLLDAENPLRVDKDGKITHPYLAPVLNINDQGQFEVPQEWEQDRRYYLS